MLAHKLLFTKSQGIAHNEIVKNQIKCLFARYDEEMKFTVHTLDSFSQFIHERGIVT